MKFMKKRLTGKEKGFTLIELLVVIGIIGLLAAVTVPTMTHFLSNGKTASAQSELENVQTAVTAMMAEQGIIAIVDPVAAGSEVNDMTAFPSSTDGAQVLSGSTFGNDYMKKATTKYYYACDTEGNVTQVLVAPAVPEP